MSPEDSTFISEEGAVKLRGTSVRHFGEFFDREGREGDYLWGRLDGAEGLISLLGGTDDARYLEAFATILEDEAGVLSTNVINSIDGAIVEKFGPEWRATAVAQ